MIDRLEAYIDSKKPKQTQGDKWISGEEAMRMLRFTSKITFSKEKKQKEYSKYLYRCNYRVNSCPEYKRLLRTVKGVFVFFH